MAFRIPLGGQLQGRPAITVPIGQRAGQLLSARESTIQRAIVGAVALDDPAKALAAVATAREKPEVPLSYTEADVAPVIEAVAAGQANRPGDVIPEEGQRDVAGVIGADPVLLAVAAGSIKTGGNKAADAARLWASIDANLLERAARAAARERQFALVPDTTTRIGQIEAALRDLDARVKTLEAGAPPP